MHADKSKYTLVTLQIIMVFLRGVLFTLKAVVRRDINSPVGNVP